MSYVMSYVTDSDVASDMYQLAPPGFGFWRQRNGGQPVGGKFDGGQPVGGKLDGG